MAISDASPKVREIRLQIHRSISGEQRILMSHDFVARELARERIVSEHPD